MHTHTHTCTHTAQSTACHYPPVYFKTVRFLLGYCERAQHLVVCGYGDGEEGVQVSCLAQSLEVRGEAVNVVFVLDAVMQAQGLFQESAAGPVLAAHHRRVLYFARPAAECGEQDVRGVVVGKADDAANMGDFSVCGHTWKNTETTLLFVGCLYKFKFNM